MAVTAAQAEWVSRVLGIGAAADPATATATATALIGGMAGWQAARGTALASLKSLENAFRAMKHPMSDRAIVLLRSIQAQMTAEPATPAQVAELEKWLATDRIVEEAEAPNGFGFKVELRRPLLAALAELRREQQGEAA